MARWKVLISFVLIMPLSAVLLLAGCGSESNAPGLAATATQGASNQPTQPTATRAKAESTNAPTATIEATNPAQMAEAYIRAIYAGDDAKAKELYLFYHADPDREERKVTLEALTVEPLSLEKAGDKDPLSTWQYFQVTTAVSYGEKKGQGNYRVGLMPMEQAGGALKVNLISGGIEWK